MPKQEWKHRSILTKLAFYIRKYYNTKIILVYNIYCLFHVRYNSKFIMTD